MAMSSSQQTSAFVRNNNVEKASKVQSDKGKKEKIKRKRRRDKSMEDYCKFGSQTKERNTPEKSSKIN